MTAIVRRPALQECELCQRPLTSFALSCFSCGAQTDAGRELELRAKYLMPESEPQPTPSELEEMLDELYGRDDDDEWTGAYSGGDRESY